MVPIPWLTTAEKRGDREERRGLDKANKNAPLNNSEPQTGRLYALWHSLQGGCAPAPCWGLATKQLSKTRACSNVCCLSHAVNPTDSVHTVPRRATRHSPGCVPSCAWRQRRLACPPLPDKSQNGTMQCHVARHRWTYQATLCNGKQCATTARGNTMNGLPLSATASWPVAAPAPGKATANVNNDKEKCGCQHSDLQRTQNPCWCCQLSDLLSPRPRRFGDGTLPAARAAASCCTASSTRRHRATRCQCRALLAAASCACCSRAAVAAASHRNMSAAASTRCTRAGSCKGWRLATNPAIAALCARNP